jgi:hypothetical protein
MSVTMRRRNPSNYSNYSPLGVFTTGNTESFY